MQHAYPEQVEQEGTGFHRPAELTAIPAVIFAWLALAAMALTIRLIGRTNWPLSEGESAIARDAWSLLNGADLTTAAGAHPVLVQLTALAFFLFGDTDYTARLVPLAAGIGILATLYWLRDWLGDLAALSIGIVWAISPVMTMSTLRLDGGTVLMLCSLIAFFVTMTMHVSPGTGKAVTLGIALAVGLTAHSLGWIILPLTLLPAMFLIRDPRLGGQWLQAGAAFLITFLVITSWFATRLTSITSFFTESLSALWNEHLAQLGAGWQATLIVLLADEPLLIILTIIGLAVMILRVDWSYRVHPAIFMSCLAWGGPLIAAGVLLSGKGPALYAVTMLPLIVVAGLGLAILLETVFSLGWQRGFPLLWATLALALLVAAVRFADMLARGAQGDMIGWLINLIALALLILLPLTWITIRFAAGTGWTLVPVALLILAVVTGLVGLRTSLLLHDTAEDRPGEVLIAGSASPAVDHIQHRLRVYSRDVTTYIQDVRDPTGGHGLMVAVHTDLADPLAWYFRDFPNLVIVQEINDIPVEAPPDVLFLPEAAQEEWANIPQHYSRSYDLRYTTADEFSGTAYRGLLLAAINPLEFGNVLEFMVYRRNPNLQEREQMIVSLREDHAQAVWGISP